MPFGGHVVHDHDSLYVTTPWNAHAADQCLPRERRSAQRHACWQRKPQYHTLHPSTHRMRCRSAPATWMTWRRRTCWRWTRRPLHPSSMSPTKTACAPTSSQRYCRSKVSALRVQSVPILQISQCCLHITPAAVSVQLNCVPGPWSSLGEAWGMSREEPRASSSTSRSFLRRSSDCRDPHEALVALCLLW